MNSEKVLANVFRVYDEIYTNDEDFMIGWRMWSFYMTHHGEAKTAQLKYSDTHLIQEMKRKGSLCNLESKQKWNEFRTSILSIFPVKNSKMHFHDQYRLIFKRVAFVMIDCCFIIKYKYNNIHTLVTKMFESVGSSEMPTHFILINNNIMDSEMDHKLATTSDPVRYKNTRYGVEAYRKFHPTMKIDRMQKTYVPFAMCHRAMVKGEIKAQKKMQMIHTQTVNRASINDYSQLYLMDFLRRSFGQCARVALLSDDNKLIKTSSNFITPNCLNIYPDLPPEYSNQYFITPASLDDEVWNDWRTQNVYGEFAEQIGVYRK